MFFEQSHSAYCNGAVTIKLGFIQIETDISKFGGVGGMSWVPVAH